MATILMRIRNEKTYLESLLYVFQNQMKLGHNILSLTIKYKDGERTQMGGTIDSIFKSPIISNLEYGDLVLLEHGNSVTDVCAHTNYSVFICSDKELELLSKHWKPGCYFIIQQKNLLTYYIINEYPMYLYNVQGNEFISENLLGNSGMILNNSCGKIHNFTGIISKQLL